MVKSVQPLSSHANEQRQAELAALIADKTMPTGALGALIPIAMQLGLIQTGNSLSASPVSFWIFAADHGLADEGVSAYPKAVTVQMVMNFLMGGAAINVFARQHGLLLKVVNAGVASPLPEAFSNHPDLINHPLAQGTSSSLKGMAMSLEQARQAVATGFQLVVHNTAPIVGFGEMGIGNSSAAALLTACLCDADLNECIGRGTGVDDDGLSRKKAILLNVMSRHHNDQIANPTATAIERSVFQLASLGGFEIAMMAGAFLGAAASRKLALVDGFIATSAALVACAMAPATRDYLLFTHQSAEPGHALALKHLQASGLLNMGLRLGEGSGAALAVPLVQSAAAFFNEMASFSSAGVSNKNSSTGSA
jgi:nicotinate-nucleotide--dimethylbenzimidazole phosphoribosyltransferase